MDTTLWIVPQNTLEQKTILTLLTRAHELVLVTDQSSLPCWEKLEAKIQDSIKKFHKIYGVQLGGTAPSHAITISDYIDESSKNIVFPLEQIASIIDTPLNIDEQFVLANSRGNLCAMKQLGTSLKMAPSEIFQKIQEIRFKDRQIQGVSQQDENAAINAISQALNGLPKSGQIHPLIAVQLPHTNYSTVIDRLYGFYENLLITDPQHITHFYGSKDVLERLQRDFENSYTDGKETDGFYYWESSADSPAIQNSIQTFLEEREIFLEDEKIKHLTPKDILNKQNIDEKLGRVMLETPNLKHAAIRAGTHTQRVFRKFYENGSIYTQEGTAIIEITNRLHFMDDIENKTHWDEPKKESDYPLSYDEKVLILLNNGPYLFSKKEGTASHLDLSTTSLVFKNASRPLIPDTINLLRQARFSPEQFKEDIQMAGEKYQELYQTVNQLASQFQNFVTAMKGKEQPFPDYEKWCELSRELTNQETLLHEFKAIQKISTHFEDIIQDYEEVYFEQNRPKTSKEKEAMKKKEASGIEPSEN